MSRIEEKIKAWKPGDQKVLLNKLGLQVDGGLGGDMRAGCEMEGKQVLIMGNKKEEGIKMIFT